MMCVALKLGVTKKKKYFDNSLVSGLFTKLQRMVVVCDFSPSAFKLKSGILPSLAK